MLYRGVVLPACQASQACQAGCTIGLGMTFPHIITCCLGKYDVSGLGHSRPWCRRRWRSPSAAAATMGAFSKIFFFFFLNFLKCFQMFSNVLKQNKMFSFSKLKGGQNGFKRGGKNVLKKSGLDHLFSFAWERLGKFWGGFVFFCLGVGVFFDMHVFNPRLPSDCWIIGRVRLWMNQCIGWS